MTMQVTDTQNFQLQFDDTAFLMSETSEVKALVQVMATACETDLTTLCDLFRVTASQSFGPANRTVVTLVKTGVNGAVNSGYSHSGSQMTVNAVLGGSSETVMYFFACEMAEILMDIVGGWDPGDSMGEGLSRFCGARLHPSQSSQSIADVNVWLFFDPTNDPSAAVADDAFRKDWISAPFQGGPNKSGNNVAGDQDAYSIGCSVLYLNYLISQLGFDVDDVIAAMPEVTQTGDSTLARMFQALTGNTIAAYKLFRLFIDAWFSATAAQLTTNNPFPLHLTDVTPAVAGQKNGIYVILPMVNAQIIYNMAAPGEAAVGWQAVPGQEIATGGLAIAFLSNELYLFSRRATGAMVFNKAAFGKEFATSWQSVPGSLTTALPPAAAGRPSELFLFAVESDGGVQFNQISPSGEFVGWQAMPGDLTTTMPVAAGMQDQNLFVFANAGTKGVMFNQAAPGGAFVGWQALEGAPQTDLPLAAAGRASTLFVFLVGADGQIWFNQAGPGGPWVGWQVMPGDRRTSIAVSAGMSNTTLIVYARMANGLVVYNQAEQGGAFVGWQLSR